MTTADRVIAALESYGLKREGQGKYRCNSPLRPGSNSHGFTLRIDGGEWGAWYDHVTAEKGSLYELADKLGIETPKREQVADTKRTYTGLDDYAKAHGVTADVMRQAGWKDAAPHFCPTKGAERPALEFVTKTGSRWRFIDGEAPTYHHKGGYQRCWYGLDKAITLAQSKQQPLVLCNGEASVVVALHHEIAAACVTSGEKAIPEPLLEELKSKWNGAILLATDWDKAGAAAADKLLEQLTDFDVKPLDLGLSQGGDLADFCMLHGADAPTALQTLKSAETTPEPPQTQPTTANPVGELAAALRGLQIARKGGDVNTDPVTLLRKVREELNAAEKLYLPARTESFTTVADTALAQVEEAILNPSRIRGLRTDLYDVDHMIGGWRKGWVVMLYGATGMGKSTFCASALRTWAALPGVIAATESAPVPYLLKLVSALTRIPINRIESGELSKQEVEHVRSCLATLRKQTGDFLCGGSPSPSELETAVKRGVEERGAQWVIVDSVSKMKLPGESDRTANVAASLDAIQDMAMRYQIPFLVTSQVGRQIRDRANKRPQIDDAADSSQSERNADVILTIYHHDYYVRRGLAQADDNLPPGTALVTLEKHRWLDAGGIAAKLQFVGGSGFYSAAKENDVEF